MLSRELNIHNNVAKESVNPIFASITLRSADSPLVRLLYQFHHGQNSKKHGSVHATYLLSGPRKQSLSGSDTEPAVRDADDVPMQSSPIMSSGIPGPAVTGEDVPARSNILARENDLDSMYRSIHQPRNEEQSVTYPLSDADE